MKIFWKYSLAVLAFAVLFGCSKEENTPTPKPDPKPEDQEVVTYTVKSLSQMTLREKVGQMFNVRPETIHPTSADYQTVASTALQADFIQYPCGGITLYAKNIINPAQLKEFTKFLHSLGNYPLLCIDEEGGSVARIGRNSNFNVPTYTSMYAIGSTGDPQNAYNAGANIGSYLFEYGLDVDFAPVCDVFSNPDNTVIGNRSFGTTPQLVADMSSSFFKGLRDKKTVGCLKHFPGHGDTVNDTHYGYAESLKTWDQISECEMIPFKTGIESGAQMIMTAHICLPNVIDAGVPSTLSSVILKDKLRGELGFQGIIITDSMGMGAITQNFDAAEAAIKAIEAGVDIILDVSRADYRRVFDAVVAAVQSGQILESRIDESVSKIIALKNNIINNHTSL